MLVINNEPTEDAFARALTIDSKFGGRLVYVVANQSAIAQFRPLLELEGSRTAEWGPEILLTPQASFIDKVSAARFKSAVAGSPGRVIAQLTEPGDILPASGTPFTTTLAASGATIAAAGVGMFVVSRSVDQTGIPANTETQILFDVESLDQAGWYDLATRRYTPKVAGWYQFFLQLSLGPTTYNNNVRVIVKLRKNGGGFRLASVHVTGPTDDTRLAVPFVPVIANGTTDFFDVSVEHNDVAVRSLRGDASASETLFSGALVFST